MLAWNRFDGLQMDVHEATIRDGDAFVMVSYDNVAQQPVLVLEEAYNGECGIIPIYDRMNRHIVAAAKIWLEGSSQRMNLYFEDRVQKYVYDKALQPLETVEWTLPGGEPVGLPIVHFKNRARSQRKANGSSELSAAIPLQDALNRTLVSMVMTAELSAFQIRVAKGFNPPPNLSPGMWIIIGGEEGIGKDQVADAFTLEQAQLVPFISQANFLIDQIGNITRTPLPLSMGGDTQSGEALKQREVGLLGKVERAQVKMGNAWEDVIGLAHRVQQAFGTKQPPAAGRWACKWQAAQLRNDAEVIANALAVRDAVGEKEFLRLIAPVFDYDTDKIEALMLEKDEERASSLAALGGSLPGFSQFALPGSSATMADGSASSAAAL